MFSSASALEARRVPRRSASWLLNAWYDRGKQFSASKFRTPLPEDIPYSVGFRQSKTALFDWTFFRLDSSRPSSYRQSSRFYSFCALPRGGWCEGVLLYWCMAVENRLAALSAVHRAFFASNACFARDEPSSKRVGGVGLSRKTPKIMSVALHSAESRQSYSRRSRCWQNGINNARYSCRVIFFFFFFFAHFYFPASGQAVVTGVIPSPRFLPSIFIAHRVQ